VKIPQSVRLLYDDLLPRYKGLKTQVDVLVAARKEARWHYESRLKNPESFALKLETGRVADPRTPEDLFACTLVVENHSRIAAAETLITNWFSLHQRRPRDPAVTHLEPYSFDFDDLRLYVKWSDDPAVKPTGLAGIVFEFQVKTFLQHAWGIATHDFVYKSAQIDWPSSRIAYQVKAMLENAELSIGEAKRLTDSAMLNRNTRANMNLTELIEAIKSRWGSSQLTTDLRRLGQNVAQLMRALRLDAVELWAAVDEATAAGEGAKTLNLSPHGAILAALIRKRGPGLFTPLAHPKSRDAVFVPLEVDLPALAPTITNKIIRPPKV
jgi:hypothetical protein